MSLLRKTFALVVAGCVGALAAAAVSLAGSPTQPPADDVTSSYSALSRARTNQDVLPARIERGIAAMNAEQPLVDESLYEGRELSEASRMLLGGLGHNGLDIYAYPTSKGRVCFTTSRGGGGCAQRGHLFAWGAFVPRETSTDQTLQLIGLVPNNVQSVALVAGTRVTQAIVGNNSFFWETPYTGSAPDKIIVGYHGGRTETVAIPSLSH